MIAPHCIADALGGKEFPRHRVRDDAALDRIVHNGLLAYRHRTPPYLTAEARREPGTTEAERY